MKLYVTALKDYYEKNYDTSKFNKVITKGKRYLVTYVELISFYPYKISCLSIIDNKGVDRDIASELKHFKF